MATRYLCEDCWFLGLPRKELRGSPALELVLWLLLLIPGAIYAWWRHRGARLSCRRCGGPAVVPEDSPQAMSLRAAVPLAPEESLDSIERASRVVWAIPLAGGVAVVALFALSIGFPGIREQRWFDVAVVFAAIAVIAHPLWSGLDLILRLVARYRSRP